MNYFSSADLARVLAEAMHRLPSDVDVVVALTPSSGPAAASLALSLQVPMTDLDGLLTHRIFLHSTARATTASGRDQCRHALLVADRILDERDIEGWRTRLQQAGVAFRVTTTAVFVPQRLVQAVDLALKVCPGEPVLEWSLMSEALLREACVDIDGVLCLDPTQEENDDGTRYGRFLAEARPLYRPTVRIHHLVTSRLERYRPQTEAWLEQQRIEFDRLSMIDLPDAASRRRLRAHAPFKARLYREDDHASIFLESEKEQAIAIAAASGKPVICIGDHSFIPAGAIGFASKPAASRRWHPLAWLLRAGARRVRSALRLAPV